MGWRGSCACGKASLEALTILARGDRSRQDGERWMDSGNGLKVDLANLADG